MGVVRASGKKQLKKWGLNKYDKCGSKDNWKVVNYKITKYRNRGKNVKLYHKDKLISDGTLNRKGFLTTLDLYNFNRGKFSTVFK